MAGTMDILIREMTIADYDQVYGLWTEIKGFGIRFRISHTIYNVTVRIGYYWGRLS